MASLGIPAERGPHPSLCLPSPFPGPDRRLGSTHLQDERPRSLLPMIWQTGRWKDHFFSVLGNSLLFERNSSSIPQKHTAEDGERGDFVTQNSCGSSFFLECLLDIWQHRMKLKVGDAVEILRNELSEAWFPAKIVSVVKNKFLVRFDHKQHEVEKVPAEDVRPRPPSSEKKKRWALGDVVEVFDCHSWRAGKVVKVLLDNKYVVKVFSSIMLKEFHGSCLRARLTWHNDQWMRKDSMYSHINFDAASGNEVTHQGGNQCGQHDKKYLGGLPPLKPLKRNNFSADISPIDAVEGSSKKRKQMLERKKIGLSEKGLPRQINEERNECSIASCGSNYLLECTVQDSRTSSRVHTDSVFNDASSSCPAKPGKPISRIEDEEIAANVHQLELQAYRSTVQAFYASGPLSWEQESLLTNLRLSLNISSEEHLLQLRQLLSAPVF